MALTPSVGWRLGDICEYTIKHAEDEHIFLTVMYAEEGHTIGTLINVPLKNRILIFLCRGYGLVGGT